MKILYGKCFQNVLEHYTELLKGDGDDDKKRENF